MGDREETQNQFLKKIKPLQRRIAEMEKSESKHKKLKETLQASEQRFKDLVESITDLMWETDENWVYTYISSKVKELLGYKVSEVLGKKPFDFMLTKEAERLSKVFNDKIINKEPFYGLESVNRHKAGYSVVLEINGVPIFDEEGQLKGYRGISINITERKKIEMLLRISESALKRQKSSLERKEIALKEIMEHVEREKDKIKKDIATNVEEILLPLLKKLRIKGGSRKYVNLLQNHLNELTSSFGRKIIEKSIKLTPREIEICSMIKGGLTSKELSMLLNVSYRTIENHRKNIRKKLGISNRNINLATFLQGI